MSELSREQVETTISRFLSWHACEPECDHDLKQVLTTDAALRAKLEEQTKRAEQLQRERCDSPRPDTDDCLHFVCANQERLKQQLAASEKRVKELEEWRTIVIGSGNDQETIIRMAASEYTKTAVQCWKVKVDQLQATVTAQQARIAKLETDDYYLLWMEALDRETAQQEEIGRLREALKGIANVAHGSNHLHTLIQVEDDARHAIASGKEPT